MNGLLVAIVFIIILVFFVCLKEYNQKEFYDNYNNEIPKVIISTYHKKNNIPNKVYKNIKKFAPNYKHIIYDDEEIIEFLKKNYSKDVLKTFHMLKGAHKADLFRYCYLYIHGGIYLDIKTELIKNIDSIFNKKNVQLYTVLSKHKRTIYQGIIATTPKNQIFRKLIQFMVSTSKPVKRYLIFTYDFYRKLQNICNTKLKKGLNKCKLGNFYLFQEVCSKKAGNCSDGLDRYGLCCFVKDNNKTIIKTRYSDYPW